MIVETVWVCRLQDSYVGSLQSLGALLDDEFHPLTLAQRAESLAFDCREMDEHILSGIAGDKAISFGIAEPLDGSGFSLGHFFLLLIILLI